MLKRIGQICRKALFSNSSGATLVEVVIAVVVLALITASVAPVLLLITKSQFSWTEQRVAESLTRNQIEYIKVATYIPGNETLPQYAEVPTPDDTYHIDIVAQPVDPTTREPLVAGDEGIQEITVSIYHADRLVLQTKNYKVDRLDVLAL
ncbi:MAG: hypothetical protein E3J81_06540 [Dehalococcoidia bacterium]|nr:MAG: hypothetical protein E3J81_06540 [Dehalococcoidia bacterium]